MGGTTPKYGLPYPSGTDRLMDGDNAIQALAEKVELILGDSSKAAWTDYVPTFLGVTATIGQARYWQMGRTVIVATHITLTSAPTAAILVSAPKPIGSKFLFNQFPMGVAIGGLTGTPTIYAPVWPRSSSDHFGFGLPTWTIGAPIAWATGSIIGFFAVYEATTGTAKPGQDTDPDLPDQELPTAEDVEGTRND